MRKLKEEQDKKSKQWAVYEQQMKQKFAKQRKLFEADLQRIAKEANEAAEQGQLAAQRVKEVVNKGHVEPEEAMEDDGEAWDVLMKGDRDEQLQEGFLKIALQATVRTEEPRAPPGAQMAATRAAAAALGPDPLATHGGAMQGMAPAGYGLPPGLPPQQSTMDAAGT